MAKKRERVGKHAIKAKSQPQRVEEPTEDRTLRIVGIGASAGGLEAFEQFFSNMPSDRGIAFILVQHLDPTGQSAMPQILSRFTKMPIEVAKDGVRVKPNSIYLLPPNKNMDIQNGALYLQEPTRPPGLRLPIDFFFRSLAKEMGPDAICIILSGTGTDGTLGLRAIKAELGTVFVQDPGSARYDGMPRSAVDTGLADFVLKPSQMPEKLIQFVEHSVVNGAKFGVVAEESVEPIKQIFTILRTRTGHDFSRYKQTTIRRRLQRRMSVNQINDIAEYTRFLKDNEGEIKALLKDLLISVTNFFRDTEAFEALKRQMKELIKSRTQGSDLRIWVAGCATGEEAYSVAMIIQECLDELEKHLQIQMYGTDIDLDALHIARTGKYPGNIAADVTSDRLRKFFIKENDAYRVKKEVREAIVFAPQNFIKDPPFSKMDLICCRNLLIYLESDVQKRLLPLLHYALKTGGILFLGPSETAGESADLFNLVERKWKIYQRREALISAERLKFPAAFAPDTRVSLGEVAQAEISETKIPELTEKIFLDSYAPTFAVIDDKYHLVYVRGRTGRYLEIASGQPTWTILDMAREGLRTELTSAVYRAISEKRKIVHDGVRVKTNGDIQTINLTVAPITEPGVPPGLLLIVFQETSPTAEGTEVKPSVRSRKRVVEMEDELRLTKENLQTTIEELEATNEEPKSANEELQSNNEELQSTNEELDTSREELQSLNEELTTLNAELQDKNELLSKANDDLKNFLNRTDIAIIFLDEELKIRSYTPATSDVFNVRDIDIGRPLSEITSRLNYDSVVSDSQEVLRTLKPEEIEVQRRDGAWYKMRILPYLTAQNVVSGLVMSFLDIDEQKKGTIELARVNQQLEDLARFPQENPSPVLRVDKTGSILFANAACTMLDFKCQVGYGLPKQYKKVVVQVLEEQTPKVLDVKGKEHTFALNFVPIVKSGYVNIYSNDITERKSAEQSAGQVYRLLEIVTEGTQVVIAAVDTDFRYMYFNKAYKDEIKRLTGNDIQVGTSMLDYFAHLPEQQETVLKEWSQVLRGEFTNKTIEFGDTNIHQRIYDVLHAPIRDVSGKLIGAGEVAYDVTERKKAEKELQGYRDKLELLVQERTSQLHQSEQNFRNLIENSPLGIRIVTAAGETLYANKSLLDIYGYDTIDELKNTPVKERYTQESYAEYLKRRENRRRGVPVSDSYEISIVRKDGKIRQLRVYRRELMWAGKMEYQTIYEDITESKRIDTMLKVLSRRLIRIQEEERTNIARELHDQIGQSLNLVKIILDRLGNSKVKNREYLLEQARSQITELIDRVSTLSLDLRPKILDDLGPVRALEWYFNRFTSQTNIRVQFNNSGIKKRFESPTINTIYRVVQEALTNVARHAHASMVTVDLKARKGGLNLQIEDNGIGFDPGALNPADSGGIIGMEERISLLGGSLHVDSKPGMGTRLTVEIPF